MPDVSKREALLELVRRKQMEDWRIDPMLWVKERLKEDPNDFLWSHQGGYEKHVWDGDVNPLAEAWRTFGTSYKEIKNGKLPTHKNVAIESATGTGKTYMLARIVMWFLDCYPNSLVVTTAPTDTQLKTGLWAEISMLYPKIKKLRPLSKKWKLRVAMDFRQEEGLTEEEKAKAEAESWQAIGFVTGAKADEESSNKARGFHRKHMLIVMEECTGIPLPILTAFQNTSTGNLNFILGVGNPDNEFDTLHRFSQQKDCRSFRVSALDHPNIVNNKEIFAGAITQSSIKSRTENYGASSQLWQAMVRGISPAQSTDALIQRKWVEACLFKEWEDGDRYQFGYNAVGVDVANSETGDKAATAWGKEATLLRVDEFQCPNATHLGYNLFMDSAELMRKGYDDYGLPTIEEWDIDPDAIGIDAVGVGVATVNAFTDHSMEIQSLQGGIWDEAIPLFEDGKNKGKPMYRFRNLRDQMYWEAREDLRLGRVSINLDDKTKLEQLTRELCIPKFEATGSYIQVESKKEIKKRLGQSPNVMDAFVYWNWVRKGYRISRFSSMPLSAGN